jgi:serine/threonine protein kinase
MEKMRRIRKQQLRDDGEREEVDSFCTEFEDWKSTREMRTERSRYKKQLKNADEGGFFSEEESSRVEVECGVRLRDFRRIRTLGQGRYGEVWLVRKKSTKVKYAMKRVYI